MAARKGTRPPNAGKGRRRGVPNKATADVREAISKVLQLNAQNFGLWLARVADGTKETIKTSRGKRKTVWLSRPDPSRAMQLALDMAEFHIPKLARTEVTGKDGEALKATITIVSQPLDAQL